MKRLTLLVSVAVIFACLGALPAMAQQHKGVPPVFIGTTGSARHNSSAKGNELMKYLVSGRATVKGVAKLLQEGASVNTKGGYGITALMVAVETAGKDVVEYLIDNGANVNAKVENAANIDGVNYNGWTALMLAACHGKTEVAKLLIRPGADVNAMSDDMYTALFLAEFNGNTDVANLLIKHGADKKYYEKRDKYGWTSLMYAARGGYLQAAKFLIAKGANVNAMSDDMYTALFLAELNGHTDVANLLIKHGADKKYYEKRDEYGWTSLMYAARVGHLRAAKFLIAKGANVNAKINNSSKNLNGYTALMLAARNGNTEVAKALVESGADVNYKTTVNIKDIFGGANKARTLVKDIGGGLTAAEFARVSGYEETAKVIEETYKKVQAKRQKSAAEQVKKAMAKK